MLILCGCGAPRPPYKSFAGLSFEPSAAAWDPATERVIVLNDRDAIVYRYQLKDGELKLPDGEMHRAMRLASGEIAVKFESITRLPSGEFLAATAFDRPDAAFRRVVKFKFGKDGPIEATPIALDAAALAQRVGRPWFKIEALAVDGPGGRVFLGIRSLGASFKEKEDLALVVRCPFDGARIGAPEAVLFFDVAGGAVGRREGISSLERDPRDGSYLMLTSWEAEPDAPASHGGHLFRLTAAALEGASRDAAVPAPLRAFAAKPEGLAILPDGRALVIFDDDRDWKKLFDGYEQSDGAFEVVAVAD